MDLPSYREGNEKEHEAPVTSNGADKAPKLLFNFRGAAYAAVIRN